MAWRQHKLALSRASGVCERSLIEPPGEVLQILQGMRSDGLSLRGIARRTGVGRSTVMALLACADGAPTGRAFIPETLERILAATHDQRRLA